MGENKKNIYLTGCPAMDILKNEKLKISEQLIKKINKTKTNGFVNLKKDYLVLLYHPVTTEYYKASNQINEILKSVKILKKKFQIIWLWPNIDAGSDIFSKKIRNFREKKKKLIIFCFIKTLHLKNMQQSLVIAPVFLVILLLGLEKPHF